MFPLNSPLVSSRCFKKSGNRAFSLIELLSVIAIIGLLTAMVAPAVGNLSRSGGTTYSATKMADTLQYARTFAITHHTYVRVALAELSATGSRSVPEIGVMVLYSSDGTLDASKPQDMADSVKWPEALRSFLLSNLQFDDSLNAASSMTSADAIPSNSNIGKFDRRIGGGSLVQFDAFIQFAPTGEARVETDKAVRFIKLGIDLPSPQNGQNPFIVRVSGITGSVDVLRKEDF